jgi:hypothetical protein
MVADKPDELTVFYPQMIGIDSQTYQTILENPVVSEIVLTRGWSETEAQPKKAARKSFAAQAASLPVKIDYPKGVFKGRTGFPEPVELKKMEVEPANMQTFEQKADKLVEKYLNRTK